MTLRLYAPNPDRPWLSPPHQPEPALGDGLGALDRLALQWVEARPMHPRGLAALALMAEDARPPVGSPA